MPSMGTKKIVVILDFFILVAIITHSIIRDITLEKQYPGDLRNRVVAARLQKDGRLPYFYKWKKGDSERYLDPLNTGDIKVSNITASPFFHELLFPICDFNQRTISIIWLWTQYALLIII